VDGFRYVLAVEHVSWLAGVTPSIVIKLLADKAKQHVDPPPHSEAACDSQVENLVVVPRTMGSPFGVPTAELLSRSAVAEHEVGVEMFQEELGGPETLECGIPMVTNPRTSLSLTASTSMGRQRKTSESRSALGRGPSSGLPGVA
jgi:hypothetical protein